jgi:hypothetical protein
MKLEDYLEEAWDPARPARPFPGTLEIPFDLTRECKDLYKMTESNGRECGYALFYEGKSSGIRHGMVALGSSFSMSIPRSNSYYNFGNVHAHPSGSIGHAGGFSAHSMQDLLTFEQEADKIIFIQFVVSGQKLYAMALRMGNSRFGDGMRGFANTKKDQITAEATDYVIRKNFRSDAAYQDKLSSFNNQIEVDRFFEDLKMRTPGFGKKMEELSIAACAEFARRFGYGFYTGKTDGFGGRRIHLQR